MKKKLPCNSGTIKNFMVLEEALAQWGHLPLLKVSVLIMYLGLTD